MGMSKFFKKMLGNVGKRIYNWKAEKQSIHLFSCMVQAIVAEFADIFKGDYEKSMDTLIELVRPMSEEVIATLLLETSVMGIPLKKLITKDTKDLPWIIVIALYAVFGKGSEAIFKKPTLIPKEKSAEQVDTLVIELKKCPFCYSTMFPPDRFGAHRYGKLLTLTIEQMIQVIEDYMKNDFQVVARETKCFHKGDVLSNAMAEIRVWLYPKQQLDLMESNIYLKQIK